MAEAVGRGDTLDAVRQNPCEIALPASGYRQDARRLRCRLGHDLVRLHEQLRLLAERRDRSLYAGNAALIESSPSAGAPAAPARPALSKAADHFAGLVESALDGPVLRYSQRQRLLRIAEARGIGRFEANLVIAVVQHRMHPQVPDAVERGGRSWLWGLVALVAIELAAGATAWVLLLRA